MERFLCIAGSERGHDFLRQCAELDVRPTLLTLDSLRDSGWPREAVEDLATMPAGLSHAQIRNTVTWMARGRQFNRIAALDEGQLQTAAELREHMRIPGMGITTAGYYRDRLAMRISARESGFAVPEFCRVLNYDELREFMNLVPAPWTLAPRIPGLEPPEQIDDPDHLWRRLEQLGDRQSHFLLEEIVEGEQFTVESVVNECRVAFSVAHRHRQLPGSDETGSAESGPAKTGLIETVDRTSRDWMELTALNGGLAPSLGMVRGVAQARFVRSRADGHLRFLGIKAAIGEDGVDRLTEAAAGLNLWKEWARLEIAHLRGQQYVPGEWVEQYAMSFCAPAGVLDPDAAELKGVEIAFSEQSSGGQRLTIRAAVREKLVRAAEELERQTRA